jgi:hypothetical protein
MIPVSMEMKSRHKFKKKIRFGNHRVSKETRALYLHHLGVSRIEGFPR